MASSSMQVTQHPLTLQEKVQQGILTPAEKQQAITQGFLQPDRPEYESLRDPGTGLLKNQYNVNWGADVNPNMAGMDKFRETALGSGPTPWASAALSAQGLDEQKMRQDSQEQGASANAQAQSSLASKYGLSKAAQERLAMTNSRDQMRGAQNVGMQGAQARAQIGMQDANTRSQFLSQLPGQENALAQIGFQNKQGNIGAQQFNIGNALQEKTKGDMANMATYQEQMKNFGANKQADAMSNSGGGGKK